MQTVSTSTRGSSGPEFLDLNLFKEATPRPELRELLREKYAGRHIDLIVAAGRLAVPIAFENRADLFSNAPVVFIAVDRFSAAGPHLDAAVTGTWMRQGWAETLDHARRFRPGMKRAVVVVGSTPAERFYVKAAREQLAPYARSMEIRYLVDRKFEDVLTEIAALEKDSVVLVGPFLRDGTGRDFAIVTAIGRISAVSKVPVFGITEASVGAGAVESSSSRARAATRATRRASIEGAGVLIGSAPALADPRSS
jgi:ABC-type uncharacterized transport system substrate-binding protein